MLAGIEAAKQVGFDPVKINAVSIRGVNDSEVVSAGRATLMAPRVDAPSTCRSVPRNGSVKKVYFAHEMLDQLGDFGAIDPCQFDQIRRSGLRTSSTATGQDASV